MTLSKGLIFEISKKIKLVNCVPNVGRNRRT